MTKLIDMINKLKESEMDDNILDNVKMTKEEKERTAGLALNKIRAEGVTSGSSENAKYKSGRKMTGFGKRWSRKLVAVAAAMVVVLAFGAFAYAAGWIEFGTVKYGDHDVKTINLENTDAYKAEVEYMQWVDEELAKNGGDAPVGFREVEVAKLKELAEKYNLVREGKIYDVDSIDKAFTGVGLENFINNNEKFFNSGDESLNHYSKEGRIGFMSEYKGVHYELNCFPSNMLRIYDYVKDPSGDENELDTWTYEDKNGIMTNCRIYTYGNSDVLNYEFVTIAGDHTISQSVTPLAIKDDPFDKSREKVVKYLDGFDFTKLQ